LRGFRILMWEHRDLILELVIVGLIGWEIYIAIHGGNQQFEVLKNLQSTSAETATTLGVLRTQQQQALEAQQKSQQRGVEYPTENVGDDRINELRNAEPTEATENRPTSSVCRTG
jgi:hypothetical protein